VIQPLAPGRDLFALLGLQQQFNLDLDELAKAYRKVSTAVHPDRFAGKSAVERRMSLQWMAAVNEARRVLTDRMTRARYLATGRAAPEENPRSPGDPEFLEKIFALQMMASDDPEGVKLRAEELQASVWSQVEDAFSQWEADGASLSGVDDMLHQLNYLRTTLRGLSSTVTGLGSGV